MADGKSVADAPVASVWSLAKPFVNGGVAGMMATTIIQPIDMVKVRLQLGAVGSPFKVASDIVKNDGARLVLVLEGSELLHAREARATTPRQLYFETLELGSCLMPRSGTSDARYIDTSCTSGLAESGSLPGAALPRTSQRWEVARAAPVCLLPTTQSCRRGIPLLHSLFAPPASRCTRASSR